MENGGADGIGRMHLRAVSPRSNGWMDAWIYNRAAEYFLICERYNIACRGGDLAPNFLGDGKKFRGPDFPMIFFRNNFHLMSEISEDLLFRSSTVFSVYFSL